MIYNRTTYATWPKAVTLPPGKSRLIRRHYLAPEEQVIIETHQSRWFFFPAPVVVAALVLFFDYWVAARIDSSLPQVPTLSRWLARLPNPTLVPGLTPLTIAALVLTAAGGLFALRRWYQWAVRTYAVTNERLIQQKGIVRHIIEEIPLQQVRDMNVYQQSLWARVFRVGTIRVQSLSEFTFPSNPSEEEAERSVYSKSGAFPYKAFEQLKYTLDPKVHLAREAGIEWWVGVPNPFRIERTTQSATRGLSHPGPPAGSFRV